MSCEHCDEIRGLRAKDRELLELNRQETYELPHGVTVTLNTLRFRVDENRRLPELGRGVKRQYPGRSIPVSPPFEFFDVSYVYCPYIPLVAKGE